MSSYTTTNTETFTLTNAKYLAAKVIADLERCSQIYGSPSSQKLADFKEELIAFLHKGYVSQYEFGFKKDGKRIVCWKYVVRNGEISGGNDSPGGIHRKADITGASYYNFMTYSSKWSTLSESEKNAFEEDSPVKRSDGSLPSDGSGYWTQDRNYTSGSGQISRQTYVSY